MIETVHKTNAPATSRSAKKHELIPDFLIIGAGKSGTTSLDKYLKQHPEIFVPSVKEPNFFGYELANQGELRKDEGEWQHFLGSVTRLDDYLELFRNAKPGQIKGETSNTYMYHAGAPERIKHYNPDIKLISILRQPASRLYSRYLHLARESRVPTQSLADCKDRSSIWWKRNDLIREGFYFKNLSPFYRLFPAENIRVFLYEELNNQPERVLAEIFAFLGVDPAFKPDLSIRYNQSGIIKNRFLDGIYGQRGILNSTVKAILPSDTFQYLKNNTWLQRTLNELRGKNLARPKIDPTIREFLTHEVYGDDIRNLQKLIGKDLRSWLT